MDKKNIREQVISSYFPSSKERHIIGGYNFVGAGTNIYDRFSLKYDGKVGTKTYWLPKNKLDLAAIKHDLAYYLHDNAHRIKADIDFLKMAGKSGTAVLANSAIGAQVIGRVLNELGVKSSAKSAITLQTIYKALFNLFTIPPYKGAGSIAGFLTNPKSGKLPKSIRTFMATYFPKFRTRRGQNRVTFTQNAFIRLYIAMSTLYDLPANVDNLNVLRKINEAYVKTEEDIPALDEVFDKYKAYLDSVGTFDIHDEFIILKKGSTREYSSFFRAFRKYIKDVNKRNKFGVRYEMPLLDRANIDIVELKDKEVIVPLETVKEFRFLPSDEKPKPTKAPSKPLLIAPPPPKVTKVPKPLLIAPPPPKITKVPKPGIVPPKPVRRVKGSEEILSILKGDEEPIPDIWAIMV